MIRYVIRRLLWACVLFLAITVLTFVMFFVIPVNPAVPLSHHPSLSNTLPADPENA